MQDTTQFLPFFVVSFHDPSIDRDGFEQRVTLRRSTIVGKQAKKPNRPAVPDSVQGYSLRDLLRLSCFRYRDRARKKVYSGHCT